MNGDPHIIEIDSLVLAGVDLRNSVGLGALIEAEVLRALSRSDLRTSPGVRRSEAKIARVVARTVARSLQGGRDGV